MNPLLTIVAAIIWLATLAFAGIQTGRVYALREDLEDLEEEYDALVDELEELEDEHDALQAERTMNA